MEALQSWFSPLLWICGVVAAIAGFMKIMSPLVKNMTMQKDFQEQLSNFEHNTSESIKRLHSRLDSYDSKFETVKEHFQSLDKIQLNLLRDNIYFASIDVFENNRVSQDAYRTLCDTYKIYKESGGNSYIDAMMEKVEKIYGLSETERNSSK